MKIFKSVNSILPVFLFLLIFIPGMLFSLGTIEISGAAHRVYHTTNALAAWGGAFPVSIKYYVKENQAAVWGFSYGYSRMNASDGFSWYDIVTGQTNSPAFSGTLTYHTILISTGFELEIPLDSPSTAKKKPSAFFPTAGMDLVFFFLIQDKRMALQSGTVPFYLSEDDWDRIQLLPPTIGLSTHLGTKICTGGDNFLVMKGRYSILIPESKTRNKTLNHFIDLSLGYEFKTGLFDPKGGTKPQ